MHRSIFAIANNPKTYPPQLCLTMIISCLKIIGVEPDDTIIVAVDFMKSWRKQITDEYKSGRAKKRVDSGIDFPHWYKKFNELTDHLEKVLDWHFIKIEHLEADDIMAICTRYYSDREVVLVTYDKDLEQCWSYPNVKIFSPMTKAYKLRPDNFNAYNFLASKIKKEASDDLTSPILNEEDYDRRMLCVNLLELPEWVEKSVRDKLDNLPAKQLNIEGIPFRVIKERYNGIFSNKDIVTYEDCLKKDERKELKKKKAKAKAKEDVKCK